MWLSRSCFVGENDTDILCVFLGYSWKLQREIEQGRNSTWKNPTDLPKVAVTWQDWDLV